MDWKKEESKDKNKSSSSTSNWFEQGRETFASSAVSRMTHEDASRIQLRSESSSFFRGGMGFDGGPNPHQHLTPVMYFDIHHFGGFESVPHTSSIVVNEPGEIPYIPTLLAGNIEATGPTPECVKSCFCPANNAFVLGWNSMVVLNRQSRSRNFCVGACKAFASETDKELSIQTPVPIEAVTTLGVSSCTIFIVMTETDILFSHVDSQGLDYLYNAVMKMGFDGAKTKVFASRISERTFDADRPEKVLLKEAKAVQRMIDHIKPSEGLVIDRGDPLVNKAIDEMGHDEIGIQIEIDKEGNLIVIIKADLTAGKSSPKMTHRKRKFGEIARFVFPRQ